MTDPIATHRMDRLSAADALQALYIDFEGNKDQPPVLLGIHRRGRGARPYVQQDVVDPVFAELVPRYLPLHDCVENVVRRAEHGDRRIVSWSEHELKVVRRDCAGDPGLVARFEARYVNAYAVARYWRNKLHGGTKPEEHTLYRWLELVGREVPAEAEAGHVGATLTSLRATLGRGGQPSPRQLAAWDRLVEHNRQDCAGMRRLCLVATRELEAETSASTGRGEPTGEPEWRADNAGRTAGQRLDDSLVCRGLPSSWRAIGAPWSRPMLTNDGAIPLPLGSRRRPRGGGREGFRADLRASRAR